MPPEQKEKREGRILLCLGAETKVIQPRQNESEELGLKIFAL